MERGEERAVWAMRGALGVAVLDTIYLTWRFLALQAGWVTPGTGLCSWTAGIDCDVVLSTREARSFFVPNAVLGWGFFSGAALWWWRSRTLRREAWPWAMRALTFWLLVASALTFWFWYLLVQLPALCPFCPWNHLWTWIATGAGVAMCRAHPITAPLASEDRAALLRLAALCIGWALSWQVMWCVLTAAGVFGDGGPAPLFSLGFRLR